MMCYFTGYTQALSKRNQVELLVFKLCFQIQLLKNK